MLAHKIGHRADLALLITRVVLGVVFIAHGWQKYNEITAAGTGQFLASLGIPTFLAWPLIGAELIGGILILLGVLSRWAALGIAVVMVVAIATVKAKMGLLGGYELEIGLLACALSVLLQGPGRYALEKKIWNKELL